MLKPFDSLRLTTRVGGLDIELETGRFANQADGAVLATYGETTVLATVVAAMGAMARAYLAERGVRRDDGHPWTLPAIFWTAMAGGFLIKGPLILMVVGLTVVALAAVVPLVVTSNTVINFLVFTLIVAVAAQGWNLLGGYADSLEIWSD